MTTPRLIKSIGRSPSRLALLLIFLVFACFALSPTAQAVTPPPVGGYDNFNTATGEKALFNLNTRRGSGNTAIGESALLRDTTGNTNTAIGYLALPSNTTGNDNIALGSQAGVYTVGSNNINIGNVGAAEWDTIRIGNVREVGFGLHRSTYIAWRLLVCLAYGSLKPPASLGRFDHVASSIVNVDHTAM